MKNIKTMNKIAKIGLDELDKNIFNISDDIDNPEGILVRSPRLPSFPKRRKCSCPCT